MASLGELFIELGVLGDDEGAKKMAKSMDEVIKKATKAAKELKKQDDSTKDLNKSSREISKKIAETVTKIGGLITAVSGAVIILNKLTDGLVKQNQYWVNLIRNSDIALNSFQKWGQVGAAIDSSLGEQGAAGAIDELNKKLFEMKLTGNGYGGFSLAGIMPTNAEDVLEQLRERIKGLNNTSATYLLEQMGIDSRMLPLLRMTREEFEALNKEMEKYRLTPDQLQTIQAFHKQMSIVNVKMQYFKDRIILKIMPHFLRFMQNVEFITEKLFNFAKSVNKLTGDFKPLILIILAFVAKIKPIAKLLSGLNVAFGGLITKIPVLGRLFVGLGGIIGRAFLPLTILYFLIDDIRAFLQGGRSGIGYLVSAFEALKDKMHFKTPEWMENLMYIISNFSDKAVRVQQLKGEDTPPIRTPEIDLLSSMGNNLDRNIINDNKNQSKQFNQYNTINTSQPISQAIMNELPFMNAYFSS